MASCSNCGAGLVGQFCHACGQKRFVESDRRLGHLLHQFVASATDLDGRVWRTVRALLFRPGLLSREYFEGRRARWISPVSLFLAVSVVYFLAPLHGGDLTLQFLQQVPGEIRALSKRSDENLSDAQLAGAGQAHSRFTTAWIEQRVHDRDAAARQASNGSRGYTYQDLRSAYDAKADDVSKALVILHVPFAAFALMIIFWRQRRYFAEHFVFALHFFAFAILTLEVVLQVRAFAMFALPQPWTPSDAVYDWIMRSVLPLYTVLAVHRAYGVGWVSSSASAAGMLATVLAVNLYFYRAVQFAVTFLLV
jgi:uncharacterized protein DUF3667